MMPNKDGHANHGHSCVKGRFAFGYATHKDRITKPMIRETIHEPWREVSWDEAFTFTANKIKSIQAKYGKGSVGGITSSRCTNEETLPRAEARARRVRQQQRRHLRARLPLADGLRIEGNARRVRGHAGLRLRDEVRRDHRDRREPDRRTSRVRFADEAPLARRRQAHRDRPARDRPRALAARRGALPLAAAPEHERRDRQRARAHDRVRRSRGEGVHREALRRRRLQGLARVHSRPAELARGRRRGNRRRPRARARGSAAVRLGAQCCDLLRPRRHRAQPGLDDRHGDRESRDVHGQHRPRRRRCEPAARPEQRARLVRHGLVPARAAGIPARVRPRRARAVRQGMGRRDRRRPGLAHSEHVRCSGCR